MASFCETPQQTGQLNSKRFVTIPIFLLERRVETQVEIDILIAKTNCWVTIRSDSLDNIPNLTKWMEFSTRCLLPNMRSGIRQLLFEQNGKTLVFRERLKTFEMLTKRIYDNIFLAIAEFEQLFFPITKQFSKKRVN